MTNSKNSIRSSALKILEKCSWTIQALTTYGEKTKQKVLLSRIKVLLSRIDDICSNCEKDPCNKKVLEDKVKTICTLNECPKNYLENSDLGYISKRKLTPKEQERERQVDDFINELKSYSRLQKNGFRDIFFIPATSKKTPDLRGQKEEKLFFIEVKTLHIPRKEENKLMSPYLSVCEPDFNHQKGLKNKVIDDIKDADIKFSEVEAENRILMIYSNISGLVDISYKVKGESPKKLEDILGKKFFEKEESEYKMEIIIFDSED